MALDNLNDLIKLLSAESEIGASRFLLLIGMIFLISIALERVFTVRLIYLLKKRYPTLHKRVVWISSLPNFSEWFKFIWKEELDKKDIVFLVYFVRISHTLIIISILAFFIV